MARTRVAFASSYLVLIAILQSADASAADTARDMLDRARQVNDARKPKDAWQSVTMTLRDGGGGERERALEIYGREGDAGARKVLVFLSSPPEVHGVGFMAWSYPHKDDDQWLYLPSSGRVRRITASVRQQSFVGSDFSFEDLDVISDVANWTDADADAKLLRADADVDGVPCAEIELTPRSTEGSYGKLVVCLHVDDSTFRRVELYDRGGAAPKKRLVLADFRPVDGIPTSWRTEMKSLDKGSTTITTIADVRYNRQLSEDIFSERSLERGRAD